MSTEEQACTPIPVNPVAFNPAAAIPHGCTIKHIEAAMQDFIGFLGFVNRELFRRNLPRLESLLMPANFSSVVSEFMTIAIPKACPTVVKNRYHNGHPDLLPAGRFAEDLCQHGSEGIEIKASHYPKAWQGHNPEDVWLMVFVFSSNRPKDVASVTLRQSFRFEEVLGAHLSREDWIFSGRSATSRRTITASVTETGYRKMSANWIYRASVS